MDRLRWGILGTGGIARLQVSDLLRHGFTVSAVGSRTQEGAQAFAAEFGLPNAHGSYQALVADPLVDVVYVATPHPFHAANAMAALQAGKHVLVEKPFAMNSREARSVVDLAAASGLVVLEAMWTRFLPHMSRIRELIAAGAIGEVRTLIADHGQLLPSDPLHRLRDPLLGGGALLDLGVYPVSFAIELFGRPETVLADAVMTETGVDGRTAVVLGFQGGRQALIHTALDARGPNTAVVVGAKGRIEIDPVWYTPTSFRHYDATGELVQRFHEPVEGRGMQLQAAELERLVALGAAAGEVLPPEQSVEILQVLDTVRERIGLVYRQDL